MFTAGSKENSVKEKLNEKNETVCPDVGILISAIAFGILGCFAGCGKEENSGPRKDIYLKVTDNQGNSFFIGKNHTMHEKDVEYDGKRGDPKFYTEAYYETGERCAALPEISFDQRILPMDKPKVYPLQQIYPFSEGVGCDIQTERDGEGNPGREAGPGRGGAAG